MSFKTFKNKFDVEEEETGGSRRTEKRQESGKREANSNSDSK